ncbi:putative carbohydrate-binding X8 domain-containing protein, plant [Dioscorea sansibarensis]
MALLFLPLLLLPIFTTITISDGAWCVCKPELSDTMLQKTIDYACGAGADCNPILKNGPCFNPDSVKSHCNYAANSYYQRKGQAQGSCDFSGTATLTTSDPSVNGCSYPSSARFDFSTSLFSLLFRSPFHFSKLENVEWIFKYLFLDPPFFFWVLNFLFKVVALVLCYFTFIQFMIHPFSIIPFLSFILEQK